MPETITCFACSREPTQQCSRCGRPYCDEHGEELCDACMRPASGVPPSRLFYGSILALLVGTVLAVYFLIQPTESASEGALRPVVFTPTPSLVQNPTAPAGTTPAANQTPGATAPAGSTATAAPRVTGTVTPLATATRPAGTPAATATSSSGGSGTYTVVSGDTLTGICEKVKPASMSLNDCLDRVVALNNLGSENATLNIGQVLQVPR